MDLIATDDTSRTRMEEKRMPEANYTLYGAPAAIGNKLAPIAAEKVEKKN